jgi:hypothetical protein
MRWNQLAAALMVACATTACLAETPEFSNNRPLAMPLLQGGRLFSGQGWWARYGEPVNATALAQAEASPSDQTAPAGPMPMYGDGNIFGPGSCDCPPPCIGHLWAGYFQNPKRCHAHHLLNRNCGACGDGCGTCGKTCCGPIARILGHGGCNSCSTSDSCGCTTPVTCTTPAADCGCKPACCKSRPCHLGNCWRGFMAHWSCGCNSCSSPVSCGCATPTTTPTDVPAPTPAAPYGGQQASQRPPVPLPDEPVLYPLPRLN